MSLKGNFDRYLEGLERDAGFRDLYRQALTAWELALQLRALRERRGLTQAQVAELLGTSQQSISRLEDPTYARPSLRTVQRYVDALGGVLYPIVVPAEELADVEGIEKPLLREAAYPEPDHGHALALREAGDTGDTATPWTEAVLPLEGVDAGLLPLDLDARLEIRSGPLPASLPSRLFQTWQRELEGSWWRECRYARVQVTPTHDRLAAAREAFHLVDRALDALALAVPPAALSISAAARQVPRDLAVALLVGRERRMPEVVTLHRGLFTMVEPLGQQHERFRTTVLDPLASRALRWSARTDTTELQKAILRSLGWWRRSLSPGHFVVSYLHRWIALEALAISDVRSRGTQFPKLRDRLRALASAHRYEYPEDRLRTLWRVRNEIAHEAAAADLGEGLARQLRWHVREVDYLFLVVLQFAVSRSDQATSLAEVWDRLEGYEPRLPFTPDDLPAQRYATEVWSWADERGKKRFEISWAE